MTIKSTIYPTKCTVTHMNIYTPIRKFVFHPDGFGNIIVLTSLRTRDTRSLTSLCSPVSVALSTLWEPSSMTNTHETFSICL